MHLDELAAPVKTQSKDKFTAAFTRPFLLLKLEEEQRSDDWSFKTKTITHGKFNLPPEINAFELSPDAHRYRVFEISKSGDNPWRERISVGRARNNDIVLPDNSISKLHAYFTFEGDGQQLRLADAGSRNGTKCEGDKVGSKAVKCEIGQTVTFGALNLSILDAATVYDFIEKHLQSRDVK